MKSWSFSILILLSLAILTSCATTSTLKEQHRDYVYGGEKYGKVTLSQSEQVLADARKGMRLDDMAIDKKIVVLLKAKGIYDENSPNSVNVLINSIYIRNAFNAVMFGFMSGADNIDGTVTLAKNDNTLAQFDIHPAYALGGIGGGQNEIRLGWLSDKFAEQTIEMILGEKK